MDLKEDTVMDNLLTNFHLGMSVLDFNCSNGLTLASKTSHKAPRSYICGQSFLLRSVLSVVVPRAVLTNNHEPDGLKCQNVIFLHTFLNSIFVVNPAETPPP